MCLQHLHQLLKAADRGKEGGGRAILRGAARQYELARRSGQSRADRWLCGLSVHRWRWQEDGDGGSLMWQKQSRSLARLRPTQGAQTQTHNTEFLCAALAAATTLLLHGLSRTSITASLRSIHVHPSKSPLACSPASWGKALLQPSKSKGLRRICGGEGEYEAVGSEEVQWENQERENDHGNN